MAKLYLDLPRTNKLGVVCGDFIKQYEGTPERLIADMFFCIDALIYKYDVDEIVSFYPKSTTEKEAATVVKLLSQIHKIEYNTMEQNRVCKILYGTIKGINFNSKILDDYGHPKAKLIGRVLALKDAEEKENG